MIPLHKDWNVKEYKDIGLVEWCESTKSWCDLNAQVPRIYSPEFEKGEYWHEWKHIEQYHNRPWLHKLHDWQLLNEEVVFYVIPSSAIISFFIPDFSVFTFYMIGFVYCFLYVIPTGLLELDAKLFAKRKNNEIRN